MIHRSAHPDVEVPPLALSDHALARAAELGDKPALVDGVTGKATTYAELAAQVRAAAAGLAGAGLGAGDVLALLSPNVAAYPVVLHATVSLGAAVTPLNPLLTRRELATQMRDAGARVLVAAAPLLGEALPAAAEASVAQTYVLGEADGAPPFAALMQRAGAPPEVEIDPDEALAAIPYSSGTTGIAKGVMLTHRNLVANIEQTGAIHRIDRDDVLVGILPFFHIYGQTVVLNLGLSRGAKIVTLARFELERFLAIIEEHRVTRAHVAPPVVLALAKAPAVERFDLSSLKLVVSGAAPLDDELALRAEERIGCPIRQGYGMTEASPVTHLTADDDVDRASPGAIGGLAPSTEARIVDPETGADTDGDGELWVRGPQVMRGYLHNPGATTRTITADGWLRTGDIARVDDRGEFRIVDRLKELIKYKGYQVAPAELEALLVSHPAVLDAAVVPIPDPEGGEAPKAYVTCCEGVAPDSLMGWVAERVAPYERVRAVELVDEIPRSPSGKILRRVLRDRSAEGPTPAARPGR
ncbi:MAG: AMP-binding protein [Nocardioidaceae bacterium]